MSADERERRFLERARAELDEGAASLDARKLARLSRARAGAVEAAASRRRIRFALPAGVVATASIALFAWFLAARPGPEPELESVLGDIELLSSTDDLELYENLEFLEWLDFDAPVG